MASRRVTPYFRYLGPARLLLSRISAYPPPYRENIRYKRASLLFLENHQWLAGCAQLNVMVPPAGSVFDRQSGQSPSRRFQGIDPLKAPPHTQQYNPEHLTPVAKSYTITMIFHGNRPLQYQPHTHYMKNQT